MLNLTVMTGRMVADPELKTTANGVSVTSFRIAVTRNYKNSSGEYDSDFFNTVAWRNTAEFAAKYFKKGDLFSVQGHLEVQKYTDKNGNNRETVELIADNLYFGESKKNESENTAPQTSGGDFDPFGGNTANDEFPEFPG